MSKDFVKLDVDMVSLHNLADYVETYAEATRRTPAEASRRLCEAGSKVASTRFQNAKYDGDNDAVAEMEYDKSTGLYSVVAYGRAAPFIEFGTGIQHGYSQLQGARESEIARAYGPVEIGTYGFGRGMDDTWTYYGPAGTGGKPAHNNEWSPYHYTEGYPPQGPMYYAMLSMKGILRSTVKRVFSEYF